MKNLNKLFRRFDQKSSGQTDEKKNAGFKDFGQNVLSLLEVYSKGYYLTT